MTWIKEMGSGVESNNASGLAARGRSLRPRSIPPPGAGDQSSEADDRSALLVMSDFHLGGALRWPMDFAARRRVATVDRELSRFIAHHIASPPPSGRWTLVLNGDTFDFMHMDLRPTDAAAVGALQPEESSCGLAFTSGRARYKLSLMAAWHRCAFAALARFLDAGHRLVFVAGNHDADLNFPAVRQALVQHLLACLPEPRRAAARRRLFISRWFWFEPGLAYIEHGHRYDPYTTFLDPIVPRVWGQATRLAESFSHVSSRLFLNRFPTLPVTDLDAWKLMDFVRWGLGRTGAVIDTPPDSSPSGQATPAIHRLFGHYVGLVLRLARQAIAEERRLRTQFHRRQRARLQHLKVFARGSALSLDVLQSIDALGVRPISATVRGVFHALYFNHVGISLLALILAAVAGVLAPSLLWRILLPLGIVLGAAGLLKLFSGWRPDPDAHPRLGEIARRIVDFTHAPVVVFGHTHKAANAPTSLTPSPATSPTTSPASSPATSPASSPATSPSPRWLNPGAWENAWRHPRVHDIAAACTCGLCFARVLPRPRTAGESAVDARLVRWCRSRRCPVELPDAGEACETCDAHGAPTK